MKDKFPKYENYSLNEKAIQICKNYIYTKNKISYDYVFYDKLIHLITWLFFVFVLTYIFIKKYSFFYKSILDDDGFGIFTIIFVLLFAFFLSFFLSSILCGVLEYLNFNKFLLRILSFSFKIKCFLNNIEFASTLDKFNKYQDSVLKFSNQKLESVFNNFQNKYAFKSLNENKNFANTNENIDLLKDLKLAYFEIKEFTNSAEYINADSESKSKIDKLITSYNSLVNKIPSESNSKTEITQAHLQELPKSSNAIKTPINLESEVKQQNITSPIANIFYPKDLNDLKSEIGIAGEEFVLQQEINRLQIIGKKILSENVIHVSKVKGDGFGYDILSYNEEGKNIFIEVKTTTGKKNTPFYLTENEYNLMLKSKRYYIYRVFDFDIEKRTGEIQIIKGAEELIKKFDVFPNTYKITRKNIK